MQVLRLRYAALSDCLSLSRAGAVLGANRVSFFRHGRSFRPMGWVGSRRSARSPLLIGLDESQPAIPWWVGLHQSPPPLHRLELVCLSARPPVERWDRMGDLPAVV